VHPREDRSVLQSSAVLMKFHVRAGLLLIRGIATKAFPRPITVAKGAHIMIVVQSRGPRRANVVSSVEHQLLLDSSEPFASVICPVDVPALGQEQTARALLIVGELASPA
jgi:hypothetical protein